MILYRFWVGDDPLSLVIRAASALFEQHDAANPLPPSLCGLPVPSHTSTERLCYVNGHPVMEGIEARPPRVRRYTPGDIYLPHTRLYVLPRRGDSQVPPAPATLGLSGQQEEALWAAAESYVGRPYGWDGIARIGLFLMLEAAGLPGKDLFWRDHHARLFCSQSGDAELHAAGQDVFADHRRDDNVTPWGLEKALVNAGAVRVA